MGLKTRGRPALPALPTLLLLLALGCLPPTSGASPTARPPTSDRAPTVDLLRIAWADVGPLTPFRVSTTGPGGVALLSLVYDTLVWKDERGLIPWLATAWEVSPDGRDYTFALAPGVRWQDGQALTAADVAFSFAYYARFPYRWLRTDVVEAATALAPDRVRVRLRQPYAPFLEDVAGGLPIIPRHIWSTVADPTTYDAPDASLGSGPYRLAEYRSAEGAYRLLANPAYFRGPPIVREIQQLNTPPETRVQALQQGQIDLLQSADASVAGLFAGQERVRVFETPPLSVVRLVVNTEQPPLDRVAVRQAIAYALDRARIAATITRGPAVVSPSVVPPETPWFNGGVRAYPFAPDTARALLGGARYTLELLADPTYREPELMQPMLQEVGISLLVRRADAQTRAQLLREKRFQLGLVQHIGVGGDPDYLRRWYSGEEANDFAQGSVFADPEYTRLAAEQAATTDPQQRQELVFRLQALLAEALPTIPLYHRRFYWLYDSTRYTPMNTWGGLMNGMPLVHNKLSFLRR